MTPPASPTLPLWSDCPALPAGAHLARGAGSEGFKVLALEAQAAGLNVYRGYDLQPARRCPSCGNHEPAAAGLCRICRADLQTVRPAPAAVILYEACDPARLAPFFFLAQAELSHPHLLLPYFAQTQAAGGAETRYWLALPERPAPVLAETATPQGLLATLACGQQIANALAHLHALGVAHGQVDAQHLLLRDEFAWLVCAPGLQPMSPAAPAPADDVRELARLLLRLLGTPAASADPASLPGPVRAALLPALTGAGDPATAAVALAQALENAAMALRQDVQTRSAAGWVTHPGRQRQNNEDSLLVFTLETLCAGVRRPVELVAVADGAGGHASGEIASQVAVQQAANTLGAWLLTQVQSGKLPDETRLRDQTVAAIAAANAELQRLREERGSNMLTTFVLAVVVDRYVLVASVGDSRAYLMRDGALKQITEDHTLVARLVRLGQLTADGAHTHPRRHQLYRALGQDEAVEADLFEWTLAPGDLLLLCSDGLYEEIHDDAIAAILGRVSDLQRASQALVDSANQAGGSDNISVILLRPLPFQAD